ncbi:unnamed protein product [Effrenium voratum]|nr:unnamed protein product [Effrenium voratum]
MASSATSVAAVLASVKFGVLQQCSSRSNPKSLTTTLWKSLPRLTWRASALQPWSQDARDARAAWSESPRRTGPNVGRVWVELHNLGRLAQNQVMKVLAITVLALAAGEVPNLRGTPSEASEKPDDHAVEEPSMVALESVGVAGATCEKWVTCKDGFFGNIRCSGSRYCEVWGPAPVPHGATCKKWVSCKDGFFGNIRCSGSRYCEVWGPPAVQFQEQSEKPDDHAVEEPSAVDLESVGVAGATCEKWVTCKDGFFGNIRCSGSRYCEVWGPAPVPHGATCKKWVSCKDGFFGNIRCSGSRYCEVWGPPAVQFQEQSEKPDDHAVEEPSAVDLESVGAAGATCEKWVTCKDGFFGNIRCSGSRYCEVWGPAPVPHGATCKKWVSCKDGFFGNIRCSGSRYCEVWGPPAVQFQEQSEKPDDHAVEEPSAVDLESVGAAGATCEKWVTCKDGFFGNIRCSGSRYCEVWGPAPVPHGATCKKWVSCKDGFFGNIRCSGSRYCVAW